MDITTRKTHAWAAQKFGLNVEDIRSVEFAVVRDGYCETCAYETTGVEIWLHNGRPNYQSFELPENDLATIVREISAMEVES